MMTDGDEEEDLSRSQSPMIPLTIENTMIDIKTEPSDPMASIKKEPKIEPGTIKQEPDVKPPITSNRYVYISTR